MNTRGVETKWLSREDLAKQRGIPYPEGEMPLLIKRFLAARELVSSTEVEKLFSPKLNQLTDPLKIKGLSAAVERLVRAFASKEKFCIYADFDLDGTSGLALLHSGFRQLGFENFSFYQPKRLSEGYGFHATAVEELQKQGVSLIITVDVGITAHAACETAKALGLDVIVTDHHQPSETLPAAKVVVNPNQSGDNSGLGYLCGAGVAFYLLRALNKSLVERGLVGESALDLKSVLDFFAIGTLTDMVPLVGDNRVLVRHGLIALEKTNRPGLRALLQALNLEDRPLTSQDVAIRFAPKLNALSRMEQGVLPLDIMMSDDLQVAKELIKTVLENNQNRVSIQASSEQEAFSMLGEWKNKKFVFLSSKTFHRGIVGLIATRICLATGVPTFIGSESEEGVIVGSARLPNNESPSLLDALNHGSKWLNRFGGHNSAAGFELYSANKENLIDSMKGHFDSLENEEKSREVLFDLKVELKDLTSGFMRWLDSMGPFGQGFPTPLFSINNVSVIKVSELRGGHKKLHLTDAESSIKMEGLYFSPPPQFNILPSEDSKAELLGEIQWNFFAGQKSLQISIKEMRSQDVQI